MTLKWNNKSFEIRISLQFSPLKKTIFLFPENSSKNYIGTRIIVFNSLKFGPFSQNINIYYHKIRKYFLSSRNPFICEIKITLPSLHNEFELPRTLKIRGGSCFEFTCLLICIFVRSDYFRLSSQIINEFDFSMI